MSSSMWSLKFLELVSGGRVLEQRSTSGS